MKRISRSLAKEHSDSLSCTVFEYGSIDSLDGADAVINGRYPDANFAVNQESDLVFRVLSGAGKLVTESESRELQEGDVAFIIHGEPYFYEGRNLHIFMVCTPPWSPDQYQEVKDISDEI